MFSGWRDSGSSSNGVQAYLGSQGDDDDDDDDDDILQQAGIPNSPTLPLYLSLFLSLSLSLSFSLCLSLTLFLRFPALANVYSLF